MHQPLVNYNNNYDECGNKQVYTYTIMYANIFLLDTKVSFEQLEYTVKKSEESVQLALVLNHPSSANLTVNFFVNGGTDSDCHIGELAFILYMYVYGCITVEASLNTYTYSRMQNRFNIL